MMETKNTITPMFWTKEHDVLLAREVLAINPFREPKGSRERAKLWEQTAVHLNEISDPKFNVTLRGVRDRINQVLVKKYKNKMAEEEKGSGLAVDPPTELEIAMEEICEKINASDKEQVDLAQNKNNKVNHDRKVAEEMRTMAMEKLGETQKRKKDDGDEAIKPKRRRQTGSDTVQYLKDKSEKDFQIKQEEIELKKEELGAQRKQQQDLMQQLADQRQQQQKMFVDFQQQQQQQTQMQMNMFQQQQQQTQALLSVLQMLAKK